MTYRDMDPDEYRAELIAAGASTEDADDAASDLRRRQAAGQ